ncbi:hypothetical protein [Deinococcus sp.]|uniref:hypothetical protein n=1 Tax=Deinococcus sp. TaxID=47478 RepID=UPI003CC64641
MSHPEEQGIVGKSVEELEDESGNRVNSPIPGENRHDEGEVMIPAIPLGTASSGVVSPAPLVVGGIRGAAAGEKDEVSGVGMLVDQSGQADDGRNDHQRDSSEE